MSQEVGSPGRWPTGTEYTASVQQPSTSFSDPELRSGELTLTPLGIPASASGQSAIAFHMDAQHRAVAVRCMLNEHQDGRLRYKAMQQHIEAFDVPSVVAANWLDEGVRVHGQWWPTVIMPWASGDPLNVAIEDRVNDSARLSRLADRWLDLVETLQDKQFAHGDLQHGNVLLTETDEFELIDLDGIWVPTMGLGPPAEYGHPNYQHVHRSDADWGPSMDTFSALVIALSILGLAADHQLSRFMTGENLLFVKPDFEEPNSTAIWTALAASPNDEVVDLAGRLHAFAAADQPPDMSVREVLDTSFDASDFAIPQRRRPAPAAAPTVLPAAAEADGTWWGDGPSQPPPPDVSNRRPDPVARPAHDSGPPPPATPASAVQHQPFPRRAPANRTPVRRRYRAPVGSMTMLVGSLIAIVGTFLPWVTFGNDSVNGYETYFIGDNFDAVEWENPGAYVALTMALVLLSALIVLAAGRSTATWLISLFASGLAGLTTLGALGAAGSEIDTGRLDAGFGLGVCLAGAGLAALGAFIVAVKRS